MSEGWHRRFSGDIEGRPVEVEQYEPSGEIRVKTTQAKDDVSEGSVEPGAVLFPTVYNEGDPITIEAPHADQLVEELMDCDFSEAGAREIARHVRRPSSGA